MKQAYKIIAKPSNSKQAAEIITMYARDAKEIRSKLSNYTIQAIQPVKGKNHVQSNH